MLVPEIQDGLHPLLLLVVLNHGLHRLVLRDHRAHIAAEAAVTAARSRSVNDNRALSIWCGTSINGEEFLIVDTPRIELCDQVLPDIIARP